MLGIEAALVRPAGRPGGIAPEALARPAAGGIAPEAPALGPAAPAAGGSAPEALAPAAPVSGGGLVVPDLRIGGTDGLAGGRGGSVTPVAGALRARRGGNGGSRRPHD